MRIAITSDLHGYLPPEVPDCDLLLIAGDMGLGEKFGYDPLVLMTDWWRWVERQVARHPVVAVAGNHDFHPDVLRALPWTYLEDEMVEIGGLKIFGTPWSNPFAHGWAFNMTEEDQAENLRKCPDDADVIVTHGPPYGLRDITRGRRGSPPEHVGSVALLDRMHELPSLKLVACGHIHSAYGLEEHRGVAVAGGSLVDDDYLVANPPIVVDL